MTKSMTELTERLAGLPEAEQEQRLERFAHAIAQAESTSRLSDEERDPVREGVADLDPGRIVGDMEIKAFWNRNRQT